MPRVSVVMATYNRAPLLQETLRSVLSQSFSDFELLLVDDGSSDDTQKQIAAVKDPRLVCLRNEVNQGQARARNQGVERARGKYIALFDDDDLYPLDLLASQVRIFETSEASVGVVYPALERIRTGDGKILIRYPMPEIHHKQGWIFDELIQRNFVALSGTMVKRECFDRVGGFDVNMRALEDWDFWIRVARCFQFKYLEEVTVKSYLGSGGVSANAEFHRDAVQQILKKHAVDIRKNPELSERMNAYAGLLMFRTGNLSQALSYWGRAFVSNPLRWLRRILKRFVRLDFK